MPRPANISGHVYLAKRKRGPDVWRYRARVPDPERPEGVREIRRTLGPSWTARSRVPEGHFTKRTAQEALQAILTDARRGSFAAVKDTGATFADAATEYLRYVAEVRQIDPATVADYRGVVDGYLVDEFGETPLEQVTPDAIDAYKERLIAEGKLSNRTIVRHLTVLHGIFKRAKRAWGLASNPASAELVERPKVVYSGEFDTLDRDEIERLATAAATAQDAAIYKVAAFTGLRQGELLGLRWGCVDFVGGLLHVRRNYTGGIDKTPKGKRVRSVPMMPDVVTTLAALKDRDEFTGDDDLVFASEAGGYLDHFQLRKDYYAALDRAGLRRIRFHDLRHAFGTAAITKLDAFAVQSYMGHQHYSTTQRYLHHKPRREDAARLQEAFASADEFSVAGGEEDAMTKASENGVPNRVPTSLNSSEL